MIKYCKTPKTDTRASNFFFNLRRFTKSNALSRKYKTISLSLFLFAIKKISRLLHVRQLSCNCNYGIRYLNFMIFLSSRLRCYFESVSIIDDYILKHWYTADQWISTKRRYFGIGLLVHVKQLHFKHARYRNIRFTIVSSNTISCRVVHPLVCYKSYFILNKNI